MKTWRLRFASYKTLDDIFNTIVNGTKTIETRQRKAPGSNKNYEDIKIGDKLLFCSVVSGRDITKEVAYVHLYRSPEEMLKKEDFKKILPIVKSKEEYLKFLEEVKIKWGKKYKYELEHFGIVAIGFK